MMPTLGLDHPSWSRHDSVVKRTVNIAEAKAKLPELIDAALRGDEIVIARRNHPLVRLVVARGKPLRPRFGKLRGRIRLARDFDAPLEDFEEYTR
jgi:prevent-host-death family protein